MNENQSLAPIQSGALSMLAVIDRAARDPSVDVAKMERLLAMAEGIHAREAKAAYDDALNRAQSEMRPISKDCHNPHTRSKYASYEAIDNAIRPIYTNHGFAMSFGAKGTQNADRVLVTCRISHRGGHTEYVELEMTADGKGARGGDVQSRIHATGSALSYAKRYIANLVWNLSFGEHDDDGNAAGRTATRQTTSGHHPANKTPPASNREAKQATPADVLLKKATEATRKWMFESLKQFNDFDLKEFAVRKNWISEAEELSTWPLDHVPTNRQELSHLIREIEAMIEPSGPEEPESELPPEIANVVFHIPPKGVKNKDYTPQTLGELYAARHDSDVANRLFGTMERFEASGWVKDNGQKMPPSEEDLALREGLDRLSDWLEKHQQPQFPDLVP